MGTLASAWLDLDGFAVADAEMAVNECGGSVSEPSFIRTSWQGSSLQPANPALKATPRDSVPENRASSRFAVGGMGGQNPKFWASPPHVAAPQPWDRCLHRQIISRVVPWNH